MTDINWHDRAKNMDCSIQDFIDGKALDCTGPETLEKRYPGDNRLLYTVAEGTGTRVDEAVASARKAYEAGWGEGSVHARKAMLYKLADLIEQHSEEFALRECLDVGKPISMALADDIPRAVNTVRAVAEGVDKLFAPSVQDGGSFSYQLRKPLGVVAAVIGWNFPLHLAVSKLAPAVAMGNCVVLKPSEFTCLSAHYLAALALESGIPAGVFNVVNGSGAVVGNALAHHQDVDLLSFTGSSATGKQLMIAAGQSNMKRLLLECGGKSPYMIFEDHGLDLDTLAADIVETAFHNQGAFCASSTRLLLHNSVKEALLPKIIEQTKALQPGDPLDPASTVGAIINKAHFDKVRRYLERGEQEGAQLLCGGESVLQQTGGHYLTPAIFDSVDPYAVIAQEEIFGPALSVFTFANDDEAIALANNTSYGLAAYAATRDAPRQQRLVRQLQAGAVFLITSLAPAGGIIFGAEPHKQSGSGFEYGMDGLASYSISTSAVQMS